MIGGVILCVGDSLTHGARDPFGLSYPVLLARDLSRRHNQDWIGIEKGINGEKTSETLRRFYDVCRSYGEASEICLWIGVNDSKIDREGHGIPTDVYKSNVNDMIKIARFLRKPIFIGSLPVQDGFGAPDYVNNNRIKEYNQALRELVDQYEGRLVWLVELDNLDPEYRIDGIHLTHEGNQWVAEQFCAAITEQRFLRGK